MGGQGVIAVTAVVIIRPIGGTIVVATIPDSLRQHRPRPHLHVPDTPIADHRRDRPQELP
jgi:hypothetical protein